MQLGFVIDHSRCIGCHACTVACKSENDVPVGSFRTWVKYTEEGAFPHVRRSFAVLRCNQCTDAPCVAICPVRALDKREDGIVDVDPAACVGCKACMQGCPYDALYINDGTGTAEKCHFCAHRTERGLAPACAVVCPTEAIVPGDFHDPESRVSGLRREHDLKARKPEAGTRPNVFYRGITDAAVRPLETNTSGGYLWAQQQSGVQLDAQTWESLEEKARARTVYDVAHPPPWGSKITGYLFAKSLAAGAFLGGASLLPGLAAGAHTRAASVGVPLLGLIFMAITLLLLVADLKRPERFMKILIRPNWGSWLARGSFVLMGYGGLLTLWLLIGLTDTRLGELLDWLLIGVTTVAAALSAGYTGWLFGQARGRVLWMRRGLWAHLIVQAAVAGLALVLLLHPLLGVDTGVARFQWALLIGLAVHLAFVLSEGRMAPPGREEEYGRAHALVTGGPFARLHWFVAVGGGIVLPAALLLLGDMAPHHAAALFVLAGLWVEEDILVRAGQALPIS